MKKLTLAFCGIYFAVLPAYAEENLEKQTTNNLEELTERLNTVKPQDYIEMTKSARNYAHQTAKKLTPNDIALLNSAQKSLNKELARKQGTPEKKQINLNINNKQQIEDFLTPPMYTYDDLN